MKLIMTVVLLAFSMSAFGSAEVKRVCTVDEKTKKEVCKNIKVHKKVEGTPVPEKPAKK
jgi:hypothetical protein